MNDKKQSFYALTLQISKITLRVRFPCTVCCTIKIDSNEREVAGEGQLKNGEALLNLSHITEIHLPARKEHLTLEKKCMLLIYLKSSSGRIPAGSIPLPLMRAEGRTIKQISRIDKCPDKNAFIEFEMKLQRLEDKKEVTIASTLEKQSRPLKNDHSQKNIKLIKSQSPDKNIEDKNASIRHLIGSQIEGSSAKDTLILRRMASKRQDGQRSSIFQTYYSGQRKVGDAQKLFALERQIDSFKTKIMILESQIANKNQRSSQTEKEIKQMQKKNEQLEIELKSTISKIQYSERANKQLTNQIKQLKERAEQEKLNYQNSLKRLQIRQNSYKQQIKTISQKLYGSQNQKQRMIYEKNLSSNQFEGRQKKLRQSFKQKEKKLVEQRAFMLKKVDSLEKDIEKFKDEIAESKSKHTDNIQHVHELKIIVESVQSEKQRFRNQCNDLRFQLTKLKNQKHILEENLDSIGKFNEQRRNFRKQLSDKDIEINQFKDKLTSLENQINRLRTQNQELDKSLKEKCNNLKLLERDYNIVLKQNGILMGDISDKQSKIASLMEELQLQMKRTKFFQGSAAELEEQFQTKQDALERELRQSSNYRTILQEQVDKLNQQLENSNQQIANNLKEIQQLEQILEEKNEWITNLQSQMIQLNTLNQQWQMEKIDMGEEKKELQDKYQQFMEEAQEHQRELNSRIVVISQKWEENASQLQASLAENHEKIKLLNNVLKEKEEHIASLIAFNEELEKKIESAFRQKEDLISEQTHLNNDINLLKESCEFGKKQISDKEAIIESLRITIEQIEQQCSNMEKKWENVSSDLKNMQTTYKKLKDQFTQYRQSCYTLLDTIGSNLKSTIFAQIAHHDQIIRSKTNFILSGIAQRNKDVQKNFDQKSDKIAKLQFELQNLIEERDLKEQGLLAAGQHLELLKRNTNQITDQITGKNAVIKQLNEQLKLKENEIQDIQAANNKKILGLNSTISQKNRQTAQLKHKNDELQQQVDKLNLELKNTTIELKKIEKEKRNFQNDHKSKLNMADSTLRTEMQRVNTLQAEKSFLQKQLRQQRESLRKVMRELQSKCYEFDDLQLKIEQYDSIGSFKESELKKLRQANSELKFLVELLFGIEMSPLDKQTVFSAKIEKYLNEPPGSKQSQILKQKVKLFYEFFSNFIANNMQLLEKLRNTSAQFQLCKSENSKEQAAQGKAISELQQKFQELTKMREKQNQSKMELLKSFEEQKTSSDALKRSIQELFKLLSTLEKEKKASVFVISPVKQIVKKIEEHCAQILKNVNNTVNKNKREWDLANIRAKKMNPKKQETVSPNIRP